MNVSPFHDGERVVQERVGVRSEAESLISMLSGVFQPRHREFLERQRLVFAASLDEVGRVWVSVLTGPTGFVRVVASAEVELPLAIPESDILRANLQTRADLGLLAIDLANRRRLRINGKAEIGADNRLRLQVAQVFFNCPKYIQKRSLEGEGGEGSPSPVQVATRLDAAQQGWIANADTFFIGSYHPQGGADVSHRGGQPGFVRVESPTALVFPDYSGNNLFNTLGNLQTYPHSGLLFANFERGTVLQLTGRAEILWDSPLQATFPGAERLVRFRVAAVREQQQALALRWHFEEYSPVNPT